MSADGIPKELSRGEQVFINSFLREPPQWIRWVKKTNYKNIIQLRLMVVTKYRIYSIKRNKMGKKEIVREGHLYDLKEIQSDDLDRCVLVFGGFKIVAFAANLGVDLPHVVLQCFYNISFTFSDAAFPKVNLTPSDRPQPLIDRHAPGPASGFEEVYLAQCDYLGATASQDIIMMVDDLYASGNQSLELDLCTGSEKDNEYALNLAPIIAAMRHNTWFTSFSLHEKSRKDILKGISDILTHNVTLTSVDLSGIESTSEEVWDAFELALKGNPGNRLQNINVSENTVGEKGILPFTNGLVTINHPMVSLKIASTGLQAKGITQVFRTLVANPTLSHTLQEIDISGNPIPNGPLSVAASDWILGLTLNQPGTDKKYLRKVNFSACAIEVPPIVESIRSILVNTIEHIDFSNNKIEDYGVQLLSSLITKSNSLSHVNLSGCGLTAATMAQLIQGATANPCVLPPNFTLDLSNNDLSKEDQAVITLAGSIATCRNIHTLKIAELNLKPNVIIPLLKGIQENNTLVCLDISGNFKHGNIFSKGENPLEELIKAIKGHASITSLILEGRKDNYLAKDIIPLFKILLDNTTLLELDVSNNSFGDDGARSLFDTLRTNYTLKTLAFDHNNITSPGWQALRRLIYVNRSLVDIKYPKKDITRTVINARDKPEVHEKLRELFLDIATWTSNNRTGTPDARPLQPSPKTPPVLPPYELVLSTGATVMSAQAASGTLYSHPNSSATFSTVALSPHPPSAHSPVPPRTYSMAPAPNTQFYQNLPPGTLPPGTVYGNMPIEKPRAASTVVGGTMRPPPPPPTGAQPSPTLTSSPALPPTQTAPGSPFTQQRSSGPATVKALPPLPPSATQTASSPSLAPQSHPPTLTPGGLPPTAFPTFTTLTPGALPPNFATLTPGALPPNFAITPGVLPPTFTNYPGFPGGLPPNFPMGPIPTTFTTLPPTMLPQNIPGLTTQFQTFNMGTLPQNFQTLPQTLPQTYTQSAPPAHPGDGTSQ